MKVQAVESILQVTEREEVPFRGKLLGKPLADGVLLGDHPHDKGYHNHRREHLEVHRWSLGLDHP